MTWCLFCAHCDWKLKSSFCIKKIPKNALQLLIMKLLKQFLVTVHDRSREKQCFSIVVIAEHHFFAITVIRSCTVQILSKNPCEFIVTSCFEITQTVFSHRSQSVMSKIIFQCYYSLSIFFCAHCNQKLQSSIVTNYISANSLQLLIMNLLKQFL